MCFYCVQILNPILPPLMRILHLSMLHVANIELSALKMIWLVGIIMHKIRDLGTGTRLM